MSSLARKCAEYALSVSYAGLPVEVSTQAKRLLLDTLGCAIGGQGSPASAALREWASQFAVPAESTIIGDGTKVPSTHAALVNGAMVRYLDYNDVYFPDGHPLMGPHPSEIIPCILAAGERQHSNGRDIIAAMVAGYELSARFTDACCGRESLAERGFNIDLRAGFIVPAVMGMLLRLNPDQIENAIGIAGCRASLLGVVDAPNEQLTMSKNLRFPWGAHDGMIAAFLAQRGFTGPTAVFEGQQGFCESMMGGDFNYSKLNDFTGFKIMETELKPFCACRLTHGHLTATIELVKTHDIRPGEIAEIKVWASPAVVEHTGQESKRYPMNKETADHSLYYLTAVAIMDRQVGPEQFSPEKFNDATRRDLSNRVRVERDASLAPFSAAGITEIVTKGGATYKKQVHHPKGHWRNPMDDEDVKAKFRALASEALTDAETESVIKTVYGLEELNDVGELMPRLVFSSK